MTDISFQCEMLHLDCRDGTTLELLCSDLWWWFPAYLNCWVYFVADFCQCSPLDWSTAQTCGQLWRHRAKEGLLCLCVRKQHIHTLTAFYTRACSHNYADTKIKTTGESFLPLKTICCFCAPICLWSKSEGHCSLFSLGSAALWDTICCLFPVGYTVDGHTQRHSHSHTHRPGLPAW